MTDEQIARTFVREVRTLLNASTAVTTLTAIIAEARTIERARCAVIVEQLLAALKSVGFVDGQEPAKGMGGMMEQVCPWCDAVADDDWAHNPGCARQAAIAAAIRSRKG